MKKVVNYSKQTIDNPNPIARFAHRARYKRSLELTSHLLPKGGALVDFGAGEGEFINRLGVDRPDARLFAIEPYMEIKYQNIRRVAGLGDLEPKSADVVVALEVLEHLSNADLESFFIKARQALKPDGRLLITVPIMYGLMLPLKEVSRSLLFRRWGDTGISDLMKATIGIPISRPADRGPTHKGFDFRCLENEIRSSFELLQRYFSPFPFLPWWLNSQAIFIAR